MDPDLLNALNALKAFADLDGRGEARILSRRKAWPAAKEIILSAFREIDQAKTYSGDRFLGGGAARLYENLDGVQINFGNIPTGIVATQRNGGFSAGVERGAALVIGQSESGILAVVRYPFQTELPYERGRPADPGELVEAVEPEDIGRGHVLALVADFFTWAIGTTIRNADPGRRERIGFWVPNPKGDGA